MKAEVHFFFTDGKFSAQFNEQDNISTVSLLSASSSPFGTTTLCGFSPSQPNLSKFFYP
jgi:hypothetical protein